MACPSQAFKVTAEQLAGLADSALAAGVTLTGYHGQAEHDGSTIQYDYDPVFDKLVVTCTSKPLIVSCGMVNSKIRELIMVGGITLA